MTRTLALLLSAALLAFSVTLAAILLRPQPVFAYDGQGAIELVDEWQKTATAGTAFTSSYSLVGRNIAAQRIAYSNDSGGSDGTLILREALTSDDGVSNRLNSVVFNSGNAIVAGNGATFVWSMRPGYTYSLDVGTSTTVGHCTVEQINGGGM